MLFFETPYHKYSIKLTPQNICPDSRILVALLLSHLFQAKKIFYLVSIGHCSSASRTMVETLMQSLSCSKRTSQTDSRVWPSIRSKVSPSNEYVTSGTDFCKKKILSMITSDVSITGWALEIYCLRTFYATVCNFVWRIFTILSQF